MKKGRAGTQKTKIAASAKKRIKETLSKAKRLVLPKAKSSTKSGSSGAALRKNNFSRKATASPAASSAVLFSRRTSPASSVSPRMDLPFSYNQTRLELLVRDPEWAYSWWDFSGDTWNWMTKIFLKDPGARAKLRIHNLSHRASYDLDIDLEAKNWYVNLGLPDTEFEAELGLLDSHGHFHLIAKSNRVRTPRNGPSKVVDPHWDPSEFADLDPLSSKNVKSFGASLFSSPRVRKS